MSSQNWHLSTRYALDINQCFNLVSLRQNFTGRHVQFDREMKTTIELRAAEKGRSTMALASRELSRGGSMSKMKNSNASTADRNLNSKGYRPVGSTTSRLSLYFIAAMLATVLSPCAAQLGSTVCSCSPPEIEITFNFSVTCNDTNVANNTGVAEAECNVSPFQGGVAIDERPVVITTIDVVELDRFNDVLKSSSVFQEFLDGNTFKYVTTSANVSGVNPTTVIGGWQFSMIGSNAQQQPLLLMWIIKFTNDCESYPVLVDGNKIAWTVFTNLTKPDGSICPAIYSKPPTGSPTLSPGLVPTPTLPTSQAPRPPSTSTSPPTPEKPPSGTQPPDGCYWAGPAYPKSGKGKGKGSYSSGISKGTSPKTKKQHSKKTHHGRHSKKSRSTAIAKGKGEQYVVEDVFAEYEDEDNYHYDYDYGDWYWCPPGYGTTAPSWPKGSDNQKPTSSGYENPRPMYMHTAQTQSPISGGDGGGGGDDFNDAGSSGNVPTDTIYTQNTPENNYWAAPPNSDASTSVGGGGDSDSEGYYSPYTPGGGGSSSHPDSGVAGPDNGESTTNGLPPTATTTTTTTDTSSGATTAILIAAVAGGSVLALVMGCVVRRKLIYGDDEEDDGGGDKVVAETQSGDDHSVSTISQHMNHGSGDGGGGGGGSSSSSRRSDGGGGGGPPMQAV